MYKHYKAGYYISNHGKVKRIRNGEKKNVKLSIDKNGYLWFYLYNVKEKKYIHRAVAELFIPKIKGKWIVDHINGDRKNNNVSNLRWVTSSENSLNRVCHRKGA